MNLLKHILILLVLVSPALTGSFKDAQLKYPRVRVAYKDTEEYVKALFTGKKLTYPCGHIFIRTFKYEKELEVWARNAETDTFCLVTFFSFTAYSGTLGPKRQQGDCQIPEGIYHISHFNPHSNFHLSLKVSYPNTSDRILSPYRHLGGDIFIHGEAITIGCIPIGWEIQKLYLMAVEAKDNGQATIPVHIFPCRFRNFPKYKKDIRGADKATLDLWENLQAVYDCFEKERKLPAISVGDDGYYRVISR